MAQVINGIKVGPSTSIAVAARSRKTAYIIQKKFPAVTDVHDALEPIRVDVSEIDRKSAAPQDHTACAFALACERHHKADGAFIGISTSWLVFGDKAIRFTTPNSVKCEIVSFDRHEDFASGVYRLSAISPAARLGVAPSPHSNKKKSKQKNRGVLFSHKTSRIRSEA